MPGTLYLTRNGLLEPLGQSQVMGYLKGLSEDYQITLITFENPKTWPTLRPWQRRMPIAKPTVSTGALKAFRHHPKLIAPA